MPISEILERSNVTITDISRASGVNLSTLSQAYKRPVSSWTVAILDATAKGLHMSASDLLESLQGDSYELQIDDAAQTIQGVRFDDPREYQATKFSVQNEVLEGWKPSFDDIRWLKDQTEHPDPSVIAAYNEDFGNTAAGNNQ